MTEREKPKKPIKDRDKNKDWEKDRRLRFNKTFDVLAALLPQYDPSKPFSKIEILQRSILLIEEIQKEKKELLAGNNKEILKNQEELENTINMLRSRNEQLMEILRKAEIPIPEFNTKNTWVRNYKLDSKIEEKFTKIKENNLNEMNLKQKENSEKKVEFEKPKKYSKKLAESDKSKIIEKSGKQKLKKPKKKLVENPITTTVVTSMTTSQPPLMCLQIISNSIIVSNTSSSSEVSNSSTLTTTTCSSSSTTFSTTATPIMATGIFVPVMKLETVKIMKNKKIKPKPVEIPGKLPIPPLPRKHKLEMEKKKKSEVIKCDTHQSPAKKAKIEEKAHCKDISPVNNSTKETDCSKALTISTTDLDSDIFENLQVPSSNQHPESLSPTAAYLMNFPLVSTKATEDDGKNDPEMVNSSKKVEEKESALTSNNQTTEMLLDDSFPTLFSINPLPTTNAQHINSDEVAEKKCSLNYKMAKTRESPIKSVIPSQQTPEKSLAKYSSSSFTIDYVSKSQPQKPTFTFSLTSSVSSVSTASTSLSSTLPIPSLTTPTFLPKSNFDFLPKPNYAVTTSSSCLNETFSSCAGKPLGIVTTTATPFSFSLTTLATTTNPTIYSSSTTKSSNFPNFSFQTPTQVAMAATNFNNNPFSIEQQITTSIGTNFTFSLTNSVSSNQQMKYTNCPSYNTFNPFSTNTIQESNVTNFANNTSYSSSHTSTLGYDNGFNRLPAKKQTTQKSVSKYNQPVNWMMTTSSVTSSTTSQYKAQTDYAAILPPPPPPPPLDSYYPDLKRNSDIFFAHPPGDDNFPWSPNKMSNILDGAHYPNSSHSFMPSTLPNLHGDLALSTTSADPIPNNNNGNQNKVQNNFFSVSQLVDNQPSNINNQVIKLSNKPLSSAIKCNNSIQSVVKPSIKKQSQNNFNVKQTGWNYSTESMLYDTTNIMPPPSIPPPSLPLASVASSSSIATTQKQSSCNIYSAESLIGSSTNHNQSGNLLQKKETSKYNRSFNDNYNPIIPPPSSDSYFSMDYLNSNVTNPTDLNNSATNYNNFLYNSNNNYASDNNYYPNAIESYNNNVNIKNSSSAVNTNSYKQYPAIKPPPPRNIYHNNLDQSNTKHTTSNMNRGITNSCSLPNYDTLPNSAYFQPAMGINSPLVEEPTFHLYHASSSSYHHHHQLPSSNNNTNTGSGGGSTSLANFNLSTICPEINDKVRWG